jgi:hypothetical protein
MIKMRDANRIKMLFRPKDFSSRGLVSKKQRVGAREIENNAEPGDWSCSEGKSITTNLWCVKYHKEMKRSEQLRKQSP